MCTRHKPFSMPATCQRNNGMTISAHKSGDFTHFAPACRTWLCQNCRQKMTDEWLETAETYLPGKVGREVIPEDKWAAFYMKLRRSGVNGYFKVNDGKGSCTVYFPSDEGMDKEEAIQKFKADIDAFELGTERNSPVSSSKNWKRGRKRWQGFTRLNMNLRDNFFLDTMKAVGAEIQETSEAIWAKVSHRFDEVVHALKTATRILPEYQSFKEFFQGPKETELNTDLPPRKQPECKNLSLSRGATKTFSYKKPSRPIPTVEELREIVARRAANPPPDPSPLPF